MQYENSKLNENEDKVQKDTLLNFSIKFLNSK